MPFAPGLALQVARFEDMDLPGPLAILARLSGKFFQTLFDGLQVTRELAQLFFRRGLQKVRAHQALQLRLKVLLQVRMLRADTQQSLVDSLPPFQDPIHQILQFLRHGHHLVASLGGTSSRKPKGGYRDIARYARARVLLAAGARGKAAIDAVHLDIADHKGLAREARDAAASGFAATACIHPDQVAVIRDAYRPDPQELAWARDVLAAADGQPGVFRHRGRMVDEPVLRHARTLVRRADA